MADLSKPLPLSVMIVFQFMFLVSPYVMLCSSQHFDSNSHDIYSMHGSPNLTRAHRSSIHRLKSADELIYEQQNATRHNFSKTPVSMRSVCLSVLASLCLPLMPGNWLSY